jgi:hypothetical protein
MRLRAIGAALALGSVIMLAGCGGSSSYTDSARSAVKHMASAVRTYNSSRINDVATTGVVCKSALHGLSSDTTLATQSAPAQYKQLGAALRHAYQSARAGFADCAAAAAALDFRRMARADTEIAAANAWIARARRLDH